MLTGETQFRVRYSETDQMGYVYYGNYAAYFEVGRTELLRKLGFTYKLMEEQGIALPVYEYKCKFLRPAHYDDLLLLKTTIPEIPTTRIHFLYELFNEPGNLITKAEAILVFVDKLTGKPIMAQDGLLEAMKPYFA
ncbi:MAG: thioesterase [Bacteroidetes bacterium RIFCSPLOWO2_02_FULL_36_8]|nr:MAG: thioesterase [Bacteroidetes bacterium RIFCSPLOWO2_02_FULL_36_8]OFY68750.1 MAG: thioesterase [Bacteroidetes bacterium RIFCSPLOWO2_12_FULL_37_12]